MKVLRESMTKFQVWTEASGVLHVRIWRQEQNRGLIDRFELRIAVNHLVKKHTRDSDEILAVALLFMPDVNAVEILDEVGNGQVLYKDWP